jgi:hypothetical protein
MSEIWKKISVKDTMSVSNLGNVRNDNTDTVYKPNRKNGYLYVHVHMKDSKDMSLRIHRLVAEAFVKNDDPKNKDQVNHIDGDKTNNKAENLEWVTQSENLKHAVKEGLLKTQARKICRYDKEDKLLNTYDSIAQAAEKTGIDDGSICKVCKNINKSAGGYKWKYEDDSILCPCVAKDDEPLTKIKDYPNYGVSKSGQVYSYLRERYLVPVELDGYHRVFITNESGRKGLFIHRLVAETFIPNTDDEKKQVNHKNMIKTDNNVKNLEWVTQSENSTHAHVMKKKNKEAIKSDGKSE